MKRNLLIAAALSSTLGGAAWADGAPGFVNKQGFGFAPGLQAGQDFVAGELVVGVTPKFGRDGLAQAAQALGASLEKTLTGGSAVLLNFGSEKAALAAVKTLKQRADVLFVERNGFLRTPPAPVLNLPGKVPKWGAPARGAAAAQPLSVSADPGTGFQWHLTVIRKTAADLGGLSATPPTVAVIDTGVDYTHPELSAAGKVVLGKNSVANNMLPFDDNGHGTHVAGLIAADAANGLYGEGVCPNCKILAVKVLSAAGWGTDFDVADGMAWTVANRNSTTPPTKVVNMSLVGPASALIAAQVAAMKTAGMVLVAAAGNDNDNPSTYPSYPGADPNTALRVMATDQNDCRAWFSNFSPAAAPAQFNIAAPGWNIYSSVPDLGYAAFSGTSMAAPITAGAAALVWGQWPALTRDALVARLTGNAKTITCGFTASTKRLDVRKAILGSAETADIGRLLDPFSGKAPVPNTSPANARLYNGTAQVAADATDRGGFYEMTGLAAGARTLKGDRAGYVSFGLRNISLAASLVNGPVTDALPQARAAGNVTITVDWKNSQPIVDAGAGCGDGCNGWEFDLVVKLPDDSYVDPYFNPGDLVGAPHVINPRDSYNDYEPLETVVIGSAAANGVYKVFLDSPWAGYGQWSSTWTGSGASVQIYSGATAIGTFYSAPPAACGANEFWYVGDLTKNGSAYTWTGKNTCSNTKP